MKAIASKIILFESLRLIGIILLLIDLIFLNDNLYLNFIGFTFLLGGSILLYANQGTEEKKSARNKMGIIAIGGLLVLVYLLVNYVV